MAGCSDHLLVLVVPSLSAPGPWLRHHHCAPAGRPMPYGLTPTPELKAFSNWKQTWPCQLRWQDVLSWNWQRWQKLSFTGLIICRVLYNIMANDYVSEDFKDRLRVAARSGRDKQTCLVSQTHFSTWDIFFSGIRVRRAKSWSDQHIGLRRKEKRHMCNKFPTDAKPKS